MIIITLNPVSDFSFTLKDKISVTAFVPEIQSLFENEESEMHAYLVTSTGALKNKIFFSKQVPLILSRRIV